MAKKAKARQQHSTTSSAQAVSEDPKAIIKDHRLIISAIQSEIRRGSLAAQIEALQDERDNERESVAQELFGAAILFCDQPKGDFACDLFLRWCEQEETWAKSPDAGQYMVGEGKDIAKIPRVWINAKSVIKSAWERQGLMPSDYTSHAKLKEAYVEANKAADKAEEQRRMNAVMEGATVDSSYRPTIPDQVDNRFAQKLSVFASRYVDADDQQKDQLDTFLADILDKDNPIAPHLVLLANYYEAAPENVRKDMVTALEEMTAEIKEVLDQLVGSDVVAETPAKNEKKAEVHH